MPKRLEKALVKQARKKGYKGKRLDRFVYGTMNNMRKKALGIGGKKHGG